MVRVAYQSPILRRVVCAFDVTQVSAQSARHRQFGVAVGATSIVAFM